jgi:hypothetical protein
MDTPPKALALADALTEAEAAQIVARFTRWSPLRRGRGAADILYELLLAEAWRDLIEAFFDANDEFVMMPGSHYAALALLSLDRELSAANMSELIGRIKLT